MGVIRVLSACTATNTATCTCAPGLSFITSTAIELLHTHSKTNFHIVAVCRDQAQLQAYLDLLPCRSKGKYRLSTHSTGLATTAESATQPLLSRVDEEMQEKRVITSTGGGCCSSRAQAEEEPEIAITRSGSSVDLNAEDEKIHQLQEALPPKSVPIKDIKAARPDLRSIIDHEVAEASGSRLAIVACGPESFMKDVQDQVAKLQWDIVKGKSKVEEIYLRSEAFHW